MRFFSLVIISATLLAGGIRANAQIPGQGPLSGLAAPAETTFEGTYQEGFENITALMERFDGRGNVSLMKLGRVAMTMGKTVGKAGSAWTRKVAKAFKRVGVVYMLDYGDSRPELKDEIETAVKRNLSPENLVRRSGEGSFAFDETYGEVSEDGTHVSDLVIILYGQTVVALKGTVLESDVDRIIRRLNKQL
ncbi:MAG: hypothetical protein IKW99_06305 [Bacteroidales bacterium]|nr:hypothetical protein [Bacteroidales bacterium]